MTSLPTTIIEPGGRALSSEYRELLRYRDLLYFMVKRDITVRYKQTALGVSWAIIQPFMTMVVFSIFLGNLAGVPSDGVPYPVFSYLGLLPWTYFAGAVNRSGASLVGHANLLSKVYFPRILIPLSSVISAFVDFLVASVVLFGIMAWYGMWPASSSVLLLALAPLTALTALGTGAWLAALNVQFRDVQHFTPFVMQLWMFVTPVVYPGSVVPEKYRFIFSLNPMTGTISAYRDAVLGRPIDWGALSLSFIVAVVVLILGVREFRRMDRKFADIV